MPETIPHADAKIFALDDFETEDVARMQIIPPGKFVSIGWIDFAGPGHQKSRQMADETSRKRLFEERQKQVNNRRQPVEKTPAESDREFAKMVVDRIVNWSFKSRVRDEDGVESFVDVPFTHDLAMTLFLDPRKGWIFGLCADFLGNIENFMPASSAI